MKFNLKYLVIFCALLFISGCASQAHYIKLEPALARDMKSFSGVQYVPVIKLCDAYGLKWEWDGVTKKVVLERREKHIVIRAGSDRILVDGAEKRLERPAAFDAGALFVPVSFIKDDLSLIVDKPLSAGYEEPSGGEWVIRTIVLDAGHGGKDIGAMGRKLHLHEKDMTLSIVKRLKRLLEENGIKVIMTRSSDNFIPLPRRAEISNRSGADLFVSIHINASRTNSLKGFECYYLADTTNDNELALNASRSATVKIGDKVFTGESKNLNITLWDMALSENRREGSALALSICASIEDSMTVNSRGVRSARFYVLKYSRIPAVLVEMGYISNRYEEMKLKDPHFLDRMTDAVAEGILRYKRDYEKTGGFTKK